VSEQLFVIVIVFFGLIMLMMMGLIVFLFLKLNTQKPSSPQEPKEIKNPPVAPLKTQSDPTLQMCINHPESPAQALCAISAEPICESCVREDDGVIFSLDHFRTYLESSWVEMESVRATAAQTEASAHLFAFKQARWKKNQTPSYVTTHYRIDIDSDEIESLIRLYVREEDKDLLKSELINFKNIEHKRDKK
jgi:hypothetical protein